MIVVFPLPLSPTIGQQSGSAVASWLSKHAWIRAIAVLKSGYLTSIRSQRSIDSLHCVVQYSPLIRLDASPEVHSLRLAREANRDSPRTPAGLRHPKRRRVARALDQAPRSLPPASVQPPRYGPREPIAIRNDLDCPRMQAER